MLGSRSTATSMGPFLSRVSVSSARHHQLGPVLEARHYSVTVSIPAPAPLVSAAALRRLWLAGTVALSLVAVAGAITLAPSASVPPGRALQWLLFVGSSVHVAATGWFYTVPEV